MAELPGDGRWKLALNATIAVVLFVAAWFYVRNAPSSTLKPTPMRKPSPKAREGVKPGGTADTTEAAAANDVGAKAAGAGGLGKPYVSNPSLGSGGASSKQPSSAKPLASKEPSSSKPTPPVGDEASAAAPPPTPAPFGMSQSEREELLRELNELSDAEKARLLASWGGLTPESLAEEGPSASELEASLKANREEMASLMYQAAYVELDDAAAAKLVGRMRELKQLTTMQTELLGLASAEELEILRQRAVAQGKKDKAAKALNTPGGTFAAKRRPVAAHTHAQPPASPGKEATAVVAAAVAVAATKLTSPGPRKPPVLHVCAMCGVAESSRDGVALKPCGRCKAAVYCGKECQIAHWNAGHKQVCPAVHLST